MGLQADIADTITYRRQVQKVAITGARGLIGSALSERLRSLGTEVLRLVRHQPSHQEEIRWDPDGRIAPSPETLDRISSCDALVHLAGESVASLWTRERMQRIRDSRVQGTTALAQLTCAAPHKLPAVIAASAIGFYGDRGDEALSEENAAGNGFLPEVCQAWERAADTFCAGRIVKARLGVVLDARGGALQKMLPAFRSGMGAALGSGKQWMSWITLSDVVNVLVWMLNDASAAGIYNVVAPQPVTQREFADELARALGRPRWLTAPSFLLRTLAGKMADEALLASARVYPQRLEHAGFRFADPELSSALRGLLQRVR